MTRIQEEEEDSHQSIFTTLGKMTDTDKVMNPQHVGSEPEDM